jgi:hypothetical protein
MLDSLLPASNTTPERTVSRPPEEPAAPIKPIEAAALIPAQKTDTSILGWLAEIEIRKQKAGTSTTCELFLSNDFTLSTPPQIQMPKGPATRSPDIRAEKLPEIAELPHFPIPLSPEISVPAKSKETPVVCLYTIARVSEYLLRHVPLRAQEAPAQAKPEFTASEIHVASVMPVQEIPFQKTRVAKTHTNSCPLQVKTSKPKNVTAVETAFSAFRLQKHKERAIKPHSSAPQQSLSPAKSMKIKSPSQPVPKHKSFSLSHKKTKPPPPAAGGTKTKTCKAKPPPALIQRRLPETALDTKPAKQLKDAPASAVRSEIAGQKIRPERNARSHSLVLRILGSSPSNRPKSQLKRR